MNERRVNKIRLINTYVSDNHIVIKTLEKRELNDAVGLFNCNEDICFATGLKCPVTYKELFDFYNEQMDSKEDFLLGIFLPGENQFSCGQEKKLVGIISGKLTGDKLWIKMMAVLPEYRGKGFGSRAIRLIFEQLMLIYKTQEVFLSVIKTNSGGMRFWSRHGFVEITRVRKTLFEEKGLSEVVIMRKHL